jgi:hypothetical protein
MRVIIQLSPNRNGYFSFLQTILHGKHLLAIREKIMAGPKENRLLAERPLPRDGRERTSARKAARSVTVNLAESPLGFL